MPSFENTSLWQRTLAPRESDCYEEARTRLRSAYRTFWDRAVEIAKNITGDLPNLTLHDERHLTALWERADLLVGNDYDINPLEAFVFGGAILLHDSGHALAAYEGGLNHLISQPLYLDALTSLKQKAKERWDTEGKPEPSLEQLEKQALFVTLRRLHAQQAQHLATRSFDGQYLIDDDDLRVNLAQLIGTVATSHQWPRNSLEERLSPIQGSPGSLPGSWRIHPIKLACLLRCSDAIQIDERRAPMFSRTLQRPDGSSQLHWIAQRLAQPVLHEENVGAGSIVFTSQANFDVGDADAWWIAKDLITIAHEELQGCYQLMRDLKLPSFTADGISGAESPMHLAKRIRTSGWRPVNAEVRITNVEHIIKLLGGIHLYGRNPSIPLREIIQNSADAIRARRKVQNDPFYKGTILVDMNRNDKNTCKIRVFDNGIGMSSQTLTGSLIEFGKSFWTSDDVQEEFPGLISSGISQIGRYGIGFFSTFIISKRISVTSRRYDQNNMVHSLLFRDGLSLRPILLESNAHELKDFSTCVEIEVDNETIDQLLICSRAEYFGGDFSINLKELIAHICPCLDCDVYVQEDGNTRPIKAHDENWYQQDGLAWLRDIIFANHTANEAFDTYLKDAAGFLRVLPGHDGAPIGRAAIGFRQADTGIDSIGGLVAGLMTQHVGQFSPFHIGAIGRLPDGPQRQAGRLDIPDPALTTWATNQANDIAQSDFENTQKYIAAQNVSFFQGNPTRIAMILVNRIVTAIGDVYQALTKGEEIYAAVDKKAASGFVEISNLVFRTSPYSSLSIRTAEIKFQVITMESWQSSGRDQSRNYYAIPNDKDLALSSFIACLKTYALERGRTLVMEELDNVLFGRYIGKTSERENLIHGAELRMRALKLSISSIEI